MSMTTNKRLIRIRMVEHNEHYQEENKKLRERIRLYKLTIAQLKLELRKSHENHRTHSR